MTNLLNTLPPKERTIIGPEGGWKENTLYLVEVSFSQSNPIHCAVMFSGYLNGDHIPGNLPGGYHAIFNPTWDSNSVVGDTHFLKAVRALNDEDQIFREAEEEG